jgi:hypothetical protein
MEHLFNKNTVGQTFFLLPTQNNITRGKSVFDQMVEATLVKNGRVNVEIQLKDQLGTRAYRKNELQPTIIGSSHNAGYLIFTSKQAVEDERVRGIVATYLISHQNIDKISPDQARQIAAILNQDEQVVFLD